ncbi:centrosome-associated zinc finger protein CP190 [Haematobia irritans]|uniref:centrosome-associated zinc finger protein CP190 n=1 Tax=Haematobia irritans TaxID=7368 RepID=UPI003F5033A5
MGEIKSVKVDNWGVFFLQKLQNFFNKTDYCDLTLQFRDNSQLKVHRLVLSACTDYFNVLEQTCEVVDDAIIMPNGLQADVVVPIVNFMYTGTLEFELKMYNRLLRTAKDMNMTVLLKLLEAHRRTMEMHPQKNQTPTSPKVKRKVIPANSGPNIAPPTSGRSLIQPQSKRIVVTGNAPQHRQPSNTQSRATTSSGYGTMPVKQQIGSTTFTRIKQESDQDHHVNIPAGGYTLLKKTPTAPASPFEQLRKGYTNNNKRPATTTFISPPAKKPNLEDVKEFAEQQRMRKQIAAEFGDDDYDTGIMDDDNIHNDDDDDDMTSVTPATSMSSNQQHQSQQGVSTSSSAVQTSASQQQQTEDPPGTTTIIVKHEGPDKPPTIVVKDSSNSKMNHAKIISEVLRQYPHLVNSNKNIKLKIMPNAGGNTQKVVVKKETSDAENTNTAVSAQTPKAPILPKVEAKSPQNTTGVVNKPKPQAISQPSPTKVPDETNTKGAGTTAVAQPPSSQKRRIDSKTMHALIALGAENTTGPWLCLRCGRNGHPISIPSYRGFRRHLINTHKETIDPALCEHCGWRSSGKRELHFHMQLEHKIRTNLYIFPECELCSQMCIDSDALNQHLIDSHPDENKQQCIYCNKIFPEELQLYTHMKTFHKKQALEDGIIDYSDEENVNPESIFPSTEDEEMLVEEEEIEATHAEKKIKILSDISLPITGSVIKTDAFSAVAGESTTSVPSEEYLQEQENVETKFVAADGSEVILTDEQRKEILSQLNQEHEGSSGVVMVLNENQQFVAGDSQSEQGAISHDETSQATSATNEENYPSNMYQELKSQTSDAPEEDTTSQPEDDGVREEEEQAKEEKMEHEHLEESKESIDNLEWAEHLVSEHDMAEVSSHPPDGSVKSAKEHEESKYEEEKSQDEISKKLKELAGEWSEDEEEEEDMPGEIVEHQPIESKAPQSEKGPEKSATESTTVETDEAKAVIEDTEICDHTDILREETKEEAQDTKTQEEKPLKSDLETTSVNNDDDDEDGVDLALKNLHGGDKEQEEVAGPTDKNASDQEDNDKEDSNMPTLEEGPKENEIETTDKKSEEEKNDEGDIKITTSMENEDQDNKDTNEKKDISKEDASTQGEDDGRETKCSEKNEDESETPSKEKHKENDVLDIATDKFEDSKKDTFETQKSQKESEDGSNLLEKDVNPTTSEDRVKSLISEWGDDDEEEEENDTDSKPNP